mmetsp:Transcript_997/g.2314  ORF Transcript_997/g.2314 Transcript_997/m.2314 type:complete len:219 (+) Transcript_997:184-840(+)
MSLRLGFIDSDAVLIHDGIYLRVRRCDAILRSELLPGEAMMEGDLCAEGDRTTRLSTGVRSGCSSSSGWRSLLPREGISAEVDPRCLSKKSHIATLASKEIGGLRCICASFSSTASASASNVSPHMKPFSSSPPPSPSADAIELSIALPICLLAPRSSDESISFRYLQVSFTPSENFVPLPPLLPFLLPLVRTMRDEVSALPAVVTVGFCVPPPFCLV